MPLFWSVARNVTSPLEYTPGWASITWAASRQGVGVGSAVEVGTLNGVAVIGLNGAAARKGMLGDQIIIVSYAFFPEEELHDYSPKIVLLNRSNQIKKWLHK